MHNQPLSQFDADSQDAWTGFTDSTSRFGLLLALMCVPLVVIGWRLFQVQALMGERFVLQWDQHEVLNEPIPARDGRILSADGVVLADIQPHYNLEVEYRWIEEPVNAAWLRREALGRISRTARRDPAAVAAARQEVLQDRDALWIELASLLHVPAEELQERREGVQRRVERMVEAVARKRAQRQREREVQSLRWQDGLTGIWQTLVAELTTAPDRDHEPLILREEVAGHIVATDLTPSMATAMQSLPHRFRGAAIQIAESRTYPAGELAGHVLGIRRPDAAGGTPIGQSGIEKAYDRVLTGRAGAKQLLRDRQGRLLEERVLAPPVDGHDVVLTIDSRVQYAAEQMLDRALLGSQSGGSQSGGESDVPVDGDLLGTPPQGGAIIVMDVWTGDVLVAASAPRVAPQVLLAPTQQQWSQIQEDPRQPLFNRVTQAAVAPGSIFKLLTSVALLENKTFSAEEPFDCQGYLTDPAQHRCYQYRKYGVGHGQVTLADALAQSCNVYFFEGARRMGPTPMIIWGKRFGFGEPTGIDLPGEVSGHLPDPLHLQRREQWHAGMTLQMAIGQGTVTATPLQLLRMLGAIASGGSLVSPRVVRTWEHSQDMLSDEARPMPLAAGTIQQITELHPETLLAIREGMELAISHPQGTGQRAYEAEIPCAGKTGTAETGGEKGDHAWFVGYAPIARPRVAFVIFLEHGGSGGQVAAPLGRELLIELAQAGYIPLGP